MRPSGGPALEPDRTHGEPHVGGPLENQAGGRAAHTQGAGSDLIPRQPAGYPPAGPLARALLSALAGEPYPDSAVAWGATGVYRLHMGPGLGARNP